MALRITPASEPLPVERITLCLYGDPGTGKSSLAFTAAKPLLFDFDRGAHRALHRQDTVQVTRWADVDAVTVADLAPYDTIVVDTAGRMLDALAADIIATDAKLGKGGVLSQQGWGRLKQRFTAWVKLLNQSGKDVVLVAHGTEKQDGETVTARLDVQGGSKDEIYKSADAMGRLFIRGGKRVLCFDPTESAFGKNPAQLPILEVPSPLPPDFLAGIIAQTKESLNRQTEAMQAAAAKIAEAQAAIAKLDTADAFNKALPDYRDAGLVIRRLFADAATAKGLTFDKQADAFVASQTEAA